MAEGHSFLGLGVFAVSDDNHLLAYSTDNTGFRQYTLQIKDLRTGELLPFKKGGFVLAMETGTPIVPIAVVGTTTIMAKHSLRIESGEVEVRVGVPIETAGIALKDKDPILARVREEIGALGRSPAPQPLSQGSSSS